VRNWITNAGLSIITVLVVLCLAEIFFRFTYDQAEELSADLIWKTQKNNIAKKGRPPKTNIGGYIFTEDELDEEIFQKEFVRILFLGDSFTEAAMVGLGNRFTDLIEDRLNNMSIETDISPKFHLFNAGLRGTCPRKWFKAFHAVAPAYKPHIVIAVFFLRDGTNLGTSLRRNNEVIETIKRKYENIPFYDISYLVRYFCNKFAWQQFTEFLRQRIMSSYLGTDRERKRWKIESMFLARIAEECKQAGIPFHLVIFPLLFNLKDYEYHEVEREIANFAQRENIPVFSLTPGFLGLEAQSLWFSRNDQHPNKKGHRIAADRLFPYVQKLILEEESARSNEPRQHPPQPPLDGLSPSPFGPPACRRQMTEK